MGNGPTYDVRPEQYATVIRDLIKHENDLTNHRIMWLLIVQGLLVNAYVSVRQDLKATHTIAAAGILVTLSAFVILYKSYHARGYLRFLGREAKRGRLREEHLAPDGWPATRIRHWRRQAWVCPWLARAGDVLEPYLFLPLLTLSAWLFLLLLWRIPMPAWIVLAVAIILAIAVLAALCIAWVWSQRRDEDELLDELVSS